MMKKIPCPLPGWEIVRVIGTGSYGKVYEIEKIDAFGSTEHSALKVISIPESSSEVRAYRDDGLDDESITAILTNRVKDISEEFQLMSALKGQTNIVSYEDHKTEAHQDDPGYDILIRMELLTSLPDYFNKNLAAGEMDEDIVIQLGIDICKALELCRKNNIIHRDIKPQNIFVNANGDFKLGDFGIARTLDHSTHATKAGTYGYMAPEVYKAEKYNASVDIYSLGLVMYWMLNERRGPFLPLPPETPKPSQNREALDRRMGGENLPCPRHASPALADVVLKACAFASEDRFSSPKEMRLKLEEINKQVYIPAAQEDDTSGAETQSLEDEGRKNTDNILPDQAGNVSAGEAHNSEDSGLEGTVVILADQGEKTVIEPRKSNQQDIGTDKSEAVNEGGGNGKTPPRKKPFLFIGIAAAVVVLIVGLIIGSSGKSEPEDVLSTRLPAEQTETPEPEPTPEPSPTPEPEPTPTPEPWGDSFPVDAYLNGDKIETLKQYRSSTTFEVVHEEKTDGSRLISKEKRLKQDWSGWQGSAPARSDLVEVQTHTTYSYRTLLATPSSNPYVTRTEYVWSDWMTSSSPVQANSSTQVNTSTLYRYRVYEYDYYYATDWGEFAEDIIAPSDERIVNVHTLFRRAAAEPERSVSMDNFSSDTDAELVYADVPSDKWYYDCISTVTGLEVMDTDEFLYFFPEQSAKVGDLVRAAVAVNRIYNGECGVLPADAELYYLVENDAMDRGIIKSGEFPDMEASVTRQQAATILYRALPLKELYAINEVTNITDMDNGTDAYRYVYQLAQAGIVTFREASGAFSPEEEITRAEMASMLDRLMHPDKRFVR